MHDALWVQAKRTQLRAGLEAAAQPFAMVGRMELPEAVRAGQVGSGVRPGGETRGDPEVYVLAAADVVQEAVAARQARGVTADLVVSIRHSPVSLENVTGDSIEHFPYALGLGTRASQSCS